MDYFAPMALLPGRWSSNVRITVDDAGRISQVREHASPDGAEPLRGWVIPGLTNLHSHAFQRAMRGLTQWRSGTGDDFWSWREAIYACAARISPQDQYAIAAQLFVEMLKSGYTGVVEFHYLHHSTVDDGPAAMADALVRAARDTGIRLRLLPVLYTYSGFGARPPRPEQQRFVQTLDAYGEAVRRLADKRDAAMDVGVALHSLRAVSPDAVAAVQELAEHLGPETPVHIHVAEQEKEVADCIAWCGRRPVRWLLDNAPLDARWCLVHATHVDGGEIREMAARGCVVGLCPTTEADLGDGIFPAAAFRAAGGRFGVGSDSQALVDPFAELRLLEYGQRLSLKRRNVSAGEHQPHTGTSLWEAAVAGGAQAAAAGPAGLQAGAFADLLVMDSGAMDLLPGLPDTLLDHLVFGGGCAPAHVLVGGKRLVRHGRHALEEEFRGRYRESLNRLHLDDLLPSPARRGNGLESEP